MTNNVSDTIKIPGVTLGEELRIRQSLSPRLKRQLFEVMCFPVAWSTIRDALAKFGEEKFLKILIKANAEFHQEYSDPRYYRVLSPYREI